MDQGSTGGSLVFLLVVVAFYAYFAIAIQTMAKKTNTPNAWMAWIPILNAYLLLKVGGKPGWWLILMIVPLINIVLMVMAWMSVAERLKKPNWLGILILIPLVNIILPGYLAFSSNENGTKKPMTSS